MPSPDHAFREEYRAREIGVGYRGWLHASFTFFGSSTVIVLAAARVHAASWLELATIPLAFVFATFAEYRGHARAMHRPVRGLQLIYRRHTLEHHRFFTHQAMAYDTTRDFKIMLFPPSLLLFFIGGMAAPIGALLFVVATPNVAWLFVATAIAYYLAARDDVSTGERPARFTVATAPASASRSWSCPPARRSPRRCPVGSR